MQKNIHIQNKKARFEFEILDKYVAGIQLTGTEIKSIRLSKARITESFCEFNDCLLYTSPSPRDVEESRMPSSA